MARCRVLLFLASLSSIFGLLLASTGDADPIYRACVDQCEKTGCVGDKCSQHCNLTSGGSPTDAPWYLQEPLYLRWKQWDCLSDCHYPCMLARVDERKKVGLRPVKYHGKWPLQRVNGIQVSFFILVNYKLPFRPMRKPYYEFRGLWHIYAIFSMNSWFWSVVFHSWLNMKVCLAVGMLQLILWAVCAGVTHHPSCWKLWILMVGGALAALLEIYDFPLYRGFMDAHALWHDTTIPMMYLWWSFMQDDNEFRTTTLIKKAK
ncbi:unnamed protein product [Withania somnifera]